jgi:phosphonate transport system substrate-binding protein
LRNYFSGLEGARVGTALESISAAKPMRLRTKLVVFLSALLVPALAHGQRAPLSFGVLNQQSPALTAERWNPILHHVGLVSGVPLQLRMGRTVQETNAMMGRGDFDFVFTNHNFQSEFDSIGFKVIARWAGEPIRAVIAVPADSPIQHLQELEGKRVSFPSTDAFVAYAVPLVALKRAGVRVEQVFGGNQDGTLAQLKAKRVEAAAVNSRFLAQYAEREHVQFREIYVSEGFPDLAVIAHPRVPAPIVDRVRRALLGLSRDPGAAPVLTLAKSKGFEPAGDRDYDGVRRIYRLIGQ